MRFRWCQTDRYSIRQLDVSCSTSVAGTDWQVLDPSPNPSHIHTTSKVCALPLRLPPCVCCPAATCARVRAERWEAASVSCSTLLTGVSARKVIMMTLWRQALCVWLPPPRARARARSLLGIRRQPHAPAGWEAASVALFWQAMPCSAWVCTWVTPRPRIFGATARHLGRIAREEKDAVLRHHLPRRVAGRSRDGGRPGEQAAFLTPRKKPAPNGRKSMSRVTLAFLLPCCEPPCSFTAFARLQSPRPSGARAPAVAVAFTSRRRVPQGAHINSHQPNPFWGQILCALAALLCLFLPLARHPPPTVFGPRDHVGAGHRPTTFRLQTRRQYWRRQHGRR